MLFAIVPMGQGNTTASQLGSMLAGPSVVPEAQMLGSGPEMYNCMECKYPLLSFPVWMRASHQTIFAAERRTKWIAQSEIITFQAPQLLGREDRWHDIWYFLLEGSKGRTLYACIVFFSWGIESILDPPFSLFLPRILLRFTPFCRQSQSDWPHRRLHLPTGQVPLHWYVRVFVNVYIYQLCLKNQTLFLSVSPSCLSSPIGLSLRWVNVRIVVYKLYWVVLSCLESTNIREEFMCVCVCL